MVGFQTFWNYAFERAAKTVAQTAVALLTVESIIAINEIDWALVGGAAALSGVVSILTSVTNFDFAANRAVVSQINQNTQETKIVEGNQ
jgi:hypothetical protein